ncbi:membrane bound O-acyl transferase family-domain-containing protein [Dendryphion nanum]|uniref:Membrane bound O-acyl transferase family-domain-containing protein n=1 Tax=Dendryphion nanum TaxID=256645 RepID=A0A9P9IK97_9PLEO|nr:membrane bound O-acyl transferase family-domain-containing protein [Dendryphion nanum]
MRNMIFGAGSRPADWPRSHYDVIQQHRQQYYESIRSGSIQPFLYPWGTVGAFVVIIYMLIPHQNRPWLRKARFLVFGWIVAFAAYSIRCTRARTMAPSFGMGLISAWSVIWIMTILVVNDAQTDFQRIERTEGFFKQSLKENSTEGRSTNASTGTAPIEQNLHIKQDTLNGYAVSHEHLGPSKRHGTFAWQPYPLTPFIERLDWVLDVFCNFRGLGWNWRTSSLPPPPKSIQLQLQSSTTSPPKHSLRTHQNQPTVHPTRRILLIANLKTLLIGYMMLDLLKTIMNHDPYFWGEISRYPSFPKPPFINSTILLRIYRLTMTQIAIKYALQTIFSLGPLFFSGVLGPSILGTRAEPWMYPETWGPYSVVFERGLAGWWAGWWHQTFRFAFEAPSRAVLEGLGWEKKSVRGKVVQLTVAFGLSGCLHACGSYTSHGDTNPLNLMAFFMIQALGIFVEVSVSRALRKTGVQKYVPVWTMRLFTFVYVHTWMYFTAPLLADDFARSGVWLFEPIPVSILRGLGFGVRGDGWWCWGGEWIKWENGGRWWNTGLSI